MSTFIKCDKCGNYTIEVIGDKELGCEYCLNKEYEE
jgi:formylmethanofuran dehydrogenase subunit E